MAFAGVCNVVFWLLWSLLSHRAYTGKVSEQTSHLQFPQS